MKKSCVYEIEMNGKIFQFGSEYDLEKHLLNYKNTYEVPDSEFHDIVFSENNKQKEVFSILKEKEIKSTKIMDIKFNKFNNITGDLDPDTSENEAFKNYMGVTALLKVLKKPGTDTFLATPFDIPNYRSNEITKLVKEGMSQTEAANQVDETIKNWEVMAEMGTEIHKIAEYFFKDYSLQQISDEINIQPDILGNYLNQLGKFKDGLLRKHGQDAIFLPEYKVFNDDLKLVGIIDLLVVDQDGQVHLYDFKTSYKHSDNWHKVKEQTYDYQLGFYRHALAAYGIPVKKANLGIVPIKINGADYSTKTFENVQIEETQDRLKRKTRTMPNPLEWNIGSVYNVINTFIPIKITENTVSSDYLEKVNGDLKKMFPDYKFKLKKHSDNVEYFKKYHVKDSNEEGYTKYFVNRVTGKLVKVKNNEELDNAIQEYLKLEEDNASTEIEKTADNIKSVISGVEDLSILVNDYDRDKNFFTQIIKKYVGSNWEVVKVPELSKLGIIAIQNKNSNYVDFLSITTSSIYNDGKPLNLGIGTNIIGSFEKDSTSDNTNMLKAIGGNIELMKIMTAINANPDLLKGNIKIGNLIAINTRYSQAAQTSPEKLLYTFNRLTSKAKVENKFKTEDLDFATYTDLFFDRLQGAIQDFPSDRRYNRILTLYEENTSAKEAKVEELTVIRDELLKLFPQLREAKPQNIIDTPELYMFDMINRQLRYIQNVNESQLIKDISKYNFINGSYMNNPDTQGDPNLLEIIKLINRGFAQVREKVLENDENFRKIIQKFKDDSGYGKGKENLIGFQNSLYSNLYVHSEGVISKDMMFKNPDTDNSLQAYEKEFLHKILWEINKRRFNLFDEDDSYTNDLKMSSKYYEVPLMRSSGQSKVQDKTYLQDARKKVTKWLSNPIAMSKKAVDGVMNKEESDAMEAANNLYEMYNRFEISESNREKVLAEHDVSYFEKNIEDLVGNFVFSKIRKEEMNKVLPIIQGVVTSIRLDSISHGLDISKYNDYLDDSIKSYVFNRSLVDDEMKGIYQFTRTLRSINSKLSLGFNYRSIFRETLQGFWKNIGASMIKHYGEEQFGFEEYAKAMNIIRGDTKNFLDHIDVIESLNLQYGMANMDLNSMNEKMTSNKKGIAALGSRHMFWAAGAPDYLNRMSIFMAQMIKDGSWEAHSMEDGKLKYDWKKDKRFSAYSKGLTNHTDYKNQKALYLRLLQEFNAEGYNLKEGDALPKAYTNTERNSLKSFANMMYGYFDHEDRALITNTFMGSLWLQFKTYFSATKNKYLLKRGQYQQGRFVHMKDEEGNLLYYKRRLEEDGSFTNEQCAADDPEAMPVYDWQGRYMEGILVSFYEGFKDWNKLGWQSAKENFMNDPVKMNNAKQFAYDMALWSLFGLLMAAILKSFIAAREKERRSEDPDVITYAQDGLTDMLGQASVQSVDDLFVGSVLMNTAFDWQPPAFKMMNRLKDSAGDTIFGNKDVSKAIVDNVGFLNQTRRFWYNTLDMYSTTQ